METISIREYAKIKKCSPQAVYKQLSTRLSTYVVEVDGKKRLSIEVLGNEVDGSCQPSCQPKDQKVDESCQPMSTDNGAMYEEFKRLSEKVEELAKDKDAELKRLQEEIQFLRDQIAMKDDQIQNLSAKNDLYVAAALRLETAAQEKKGLMQRLAERFKKPASDVIYEEDAGTRQEPR